MKRVFNFAAGPSMLPLSVLEQAQKDLVSYQDTGSSVMEMSHRSPAFMKIAEDTEQTLRRIMKIPDDYAVLFLQGGASTQFSMIPMNLADQGDTTAYVVSGSFAKKSWAEGKRWTNAVVVASSEEDHFTHLPSFTPDRIPEGARYVHITGNNTIYGTAYHQVPETGGVTLVGDYSSSILGEELDVTKFGLVYAGAQKNMGIAGLTVVILRKDLVRSDLSELVPTMLRYDVMVKHGSMYNTPPCFALYMAGLVFHWVEDQGGVAALEKINRRKSSLLYDYIDESAMFQGVAAKKDRSLMNVTFTLPSQELTDAFLALCAKRQLTNVKGHRSVGGCRASIYNAMPVEGVEKLLEAMKDFEKGERA